MKLLTKEVIETLKKNKAGGSDPLCAVHFFNPAGPGDWFAISLNEKTGIAFGYVSIFGDWNDELGDFSMQELIDFKGTFGLGIERDLGWSPTPLSEVKEKYTKR